MKTGKNIAVLDTSAVVSGIFWKTDGHRCLAALARRRFVIAVSDEVIAEYHRIAAQLEREFKIDPKPALNWLESVARKVAPAVFSSPICRDESDDIFIGCALAASAEFIVTHDPDLLVLEKPFGIEIMRPREFLRKIFK
jgi:putative PIN family toxin of toxin-antitoxin system